jgi:hypothetical protein
MSWFRVRRTSQYTRLASPAMVDSPGPGPVVLPDASDQKFLALAKASVVWLVTGNMKDFPVRARRGVTVISSAEYRAAVETRRAGDEAG